MDHDNQQDTPGTDSAPNSPSAPEAHESAHALRQAKLDKLAALQAAGKDPFAQVRYDRTHMAAEILARFEELEGQEVVLAGRLMSKRDMGKAGFGDLSDESGRVQLYFKTDLIGAEAFALFSQLDLGDILGCRGTVFKTRTGQISVQLSEFTLLSKILASLPEKFHGLTDIEQRYRQRYVDLIMNREVLTRFQQRSLMLREIRNFLDARGFLEVETPMLHAIAGGATAEPFVTHWNVLKADYYLRIAIELHLKRLIVGGMEKVYEIGRVFRNEGVSTRHNPEFSMLELYWAYVDYHDILELTQALVVHIADTVFKSRSVQYGEHTLDLTPPFRRMTFDAAMREYAGVGLDGLRTLEDVKREAARLQLPLPKDGGYEKSLDEIFKEVVEPNLVQPTFINDYPKGLSPLAKSMSREDKLAGGYPADLDICYRFELFMSCMEVANAFSELNDSLDQRQRMEEQVADRAEGISELDEDFITALDFAMPPTGGLGIGIDRLMMLLSGTDSIREVLLFPQLRGR
jgi:lysyl-tRNA synthetase class 2